MKASKEIDSSTHRKVMLAEDRLPRRWYNVLADLPSPPRPPLDPATGEPVSPEMLAPLFPASLIEQEVCTDRYVDIPDGILEKLAIWRPTPLVRARGLEALDQVAITGDYPDVIVGCCGGGSNFAGLALPFVRDKIGGRDTRIVAVEPTSCPTLTRGPYGYDFGDTGEMTPLLAMYTLGHDFIPAPIHAGGLRYHGMAPIVSQLVDERIIEPLAVDQLETFSAGITFARCEGHIPAPETCHAIAGVIREAERAKQEGVERTILMSWSGHGLIDLAAYDAFLAGRLERYELPEHEIRRALAAIEGLPPVAP